MCNASLYKKYVYCYQLHAILSNKYEGKKSFVIKKMFIQGLFLNSSERKGSLENSTPQASSAVENGVTHQMFSVYTTPEELKTEQSLVLLVLCLRKTRTRKSHDYRDTIVLEKLRFQIVFLPHENAKLEFSNSSGLKSVFEKSRFRDRLVWTTCLTVEITPRFHNNAAFTNSFYLPSWSSSKVQEKNLGTRLSSTYRKNTTLQTIISGNLS